MKANRSNLKSHKIIYADGASDFGKIILDYIIKEAKKNISQSGAFNMVISGGSTPHPFYKEISIQNVKASIDWSKFNLYFIDERCVTPQSDQNNYNQCYNMWLKYLNSFIHILVISPFRN